MRLKKRYEKALELLEVTPQESVADSKTNAKLRTVAKRALRQLIAFEGGKS